MPVTPATCYVTSEDRSERFGTVYASGAGMQGLGWLEGILGTVRCASCSAVYERDDVSVVGNRDEYWFLRCSCRACGISGIGVVIVKEIGGNETAGVRPEPLQLDDVISAHELLRDYAGGVDGLFEGTGRR